MDSPVRGRPLDYTPEALETKIQEYFIACENEELIIDSTKGPISRRKPFTISSLCLYLGITRETWSVYSNRPDYINMCALAKLRCENALELGGLTGQLNPIMTIFALKNCHGWKDNYDLGLNNQAPQPLSALDVHQMLAARQRLELTDGGGD